MVRQRAAERSSLVRERCPLLAEALPLIGHVQIRNRGTIGGSLSHADPAAELCAVIRLMEAAIVIRGAGGTRVLRPDAFFVDYLTTAMAPDELLVEVRIPAWPSGAGWSYQEISRRFGDFAVVGTATLLRKGADDTIVDARMAFSGVSGVPVRAHGAEQLMLGERPSTDLFAAAADRAANDLDPHSDIQASAAYRRHIARVLARRTLGTALLRSEPAA
jgi:CO/xanthine dehydrogenase FAD-binding subunit